MLVVVVGLALLFDFTNGFHDTANAIATTVATKAVPPKVAVLGAAILNFFGALVSLEVAATVAHGVVRPEAIDLHVVLAGLVAAIIWNLFTWRFGLPTSSSHALIGGIAGAAIVAGGGDVIEWQGLSGKVLAPSLVAPILGFLTALLLMKLIARLIRHKNYSHESKVFRRMQIISGGFVAFTHGTNDAQKTMGIIALALIAGQPVAEFHVPLWVVLSAASAMALGTYLGGWRIIDTLGRKLVELNSPQGFAAEASTASLLGLSAHFGFPVSTTHTISGSIIGVGAATNRTKVRWKVAKDILIAWCVTIPIVALIGGLMQLMSLLPQGTVFVVAFASITALVIVVTRNWQRDSLAQYRVALSPISRVRNFRQRRYDRKTNTDQSPDKWSPYPKV